MGDFCLHWAWGTNGTGSQELQGISLGGCWQGDEGAPEAGCLPRGGSVPAVADLCVPGWSTSLPRGSTPLASEDKPSRQICCTDQLRTLRGMGRSVPGASGGAMCSRASRGSPRVRGEPARRAACSPEQPRGTCPERPLQGPALPLHRPRNSAARKVTPGRRHREACLCPVARAFSPQTVQAPA